MDTLCIVKVGAIDRGIDGTDEYLRVTDNTQDHKLDDIEAHFDRLYYRNSSQPGGYFCPGVTAMAHPYNGFVVIVHHRYDN